MSRPFDYEHQATLCAARIDHTAMMLDPVLVVTILTGLLQVFGSCWTRNDSPDPAMAAEAFQRKYTENPKKMRKRVARRVRAEASEPMTKEQSFMFADAIIAQILETPDEVIAAACNEAPSDL
jgi:hypothetical protein